MFTCQNHEKDDPVREPKPSNESTAEKNYRLMGGSLCRLCFTEYFRESASLSSTAGTWYTTVKTMEKFLEIGPIRSYLADFLGDIFGAGAPNWID